MITPRSQGFGAELVRCMVGDRNTSLPLKIWLAEACVSSLPDGKAPEDPGSSNECTYESDEPCFSEGRLSSRRCLLELRLLALKLRRGGPSILSLLRSTLRLPNLLKSMLLRITSELVRLASILGRELRPPPAEIGERVALTLSSSAGVVVRMGGGVGLLSLVACIEFRFERAPLGLILPSVGAGGAKRSSGICRAVVSSTKILSTFKASFPKLKKEKKY